MGSSRGLGTWASAVRGRARFHQPVGVDRSLARCRKREGERPEQDPGEGRPLAPRPQDGRGSRPEQNPREGPAPGTMAPGRQGQQTQAEPQGRPGPWHHGPRTAGAGRGRGSRGTVCLISGHTLGLCLAAQSYLTLCNPMDSSLPGSSVHGDSPGKNTRVDCHALLQGNLPTRGMKPRSPALQADSLLTEPPEKPISIFIVY